MSASLKSENEALRLANEKLGAELEKLNQELAAYEMRLGKGDYNPATTKVRCFFHQQSRLHALSLTPSSLSVHPMQILHLINNPTALARKKNSEVVRTRRSFYRQSLPC